MKNIPEKITAKPVKKRRLDNVARRRSETADVQDIGRIPPCKNKPRRERCRLNLLAALKAYWPDRFPLPFCKDHLDFIHEVQEKIIHGGKKAIAMPRGSGKTTILECAVIWAVMYGHRKYVFVASASREDVKKIHDSIEKTLLSNPTLLSDFPEMIAPIRHVDGEARRCNGQTYKSKKTRIEWTATHFFLAAIQGAPCSESVIEFGSFGTTIRGKKFTTLDGRVRRPDLLLIDDFQTEESAANPRQCAKRLKRVNGSMKGLVGPSGTIAAFAAVTIMEPNDAAAQLVSRISNPAWVGTKVQMIKSFPKNMKLWEAFWEKHIEDTSVGRDTTPSATAFYRKHRAEMEEGSEVYWPQRKEPHELSALQRAMVLYFEDQSTFWSEYQNDPRAGDEGSEFVALRVDELAARMNGYPRLAVPSWATHITAASDQHGALVFWMVCAWNAENATGAVIDYGTTPDQRRRDFTMRTAHYTLEQVYKMHPDAALQAGLTDTITSLIGFDFKRGETSMRPDLTLSDMGWKPDIVEAVKRKCGGNSMMLSKGKGIKAGNKPMSAYVRRKGEIHGDCFYIPNIKGTREHPHVQVDTNTWKTRVYNALKVADGTPGAITFYQGRSNEHKTLALHMVAETATQTEGYGRRMLEWNLPPNKPDNHWFDCLVLCRVAAAMIGVKTGIGEATPEGKKRRTYLATDFKKVG